MPKASSRSIQIESGRSIGDFHHFQITRISIVHGCHIFSGLSTILKHFVQFCRCYQLFLCHLLLFCKLEVFGPHEQLRMENSWNDGVLKYWGYVTISLSNVILLFAIGFGLIFSQYSDRSRHELQFNLIFMYLVRKMLERRRNNKWIEEG